MTTQTPAQPQLRPSASSARLPLLSYRHVIWNFAQRDLKARYKSALLGWAWALLVPLMTVIVYSLVFSLFFGAVPPPMANGHPGIYAVYFLCGLIPWTLVSAGTQRGMGSLLSTGKLMQKIYLPAYAPVLGTVIALLVQFFIEVGILVVIMLALQNWSLTWLLVPAWFVLYVAFVASLAMIAAIVNVYVRDLTLMIGVVFQLLFFLTPIIYTIDRVPEYVGSIPVRAIIEASPFTQFIMSFRDLVYGGVVPSAGRWAVLLAWAAVLALLAVFTFRRIGRDVGERI